MKSIIDCNKTYTIRKETESDYRAVENLTREAFWNVYRPGCTEHYVLHQFRSRPEFVKELDYVMEVGGELIGHIMFVRAEIKADDGRVMPIMTFGPISIHPDFQRKGYGKILLDFALEKAAEMGVGAVCMEGNIDFYKHAGFTLASRLDIHYHNEPLDAEVPYFLAQELIPGYLSSPTLRGSRRGSLSLLYTPPQGYFAAIDQPEAFAAYEATFPPKEKKVLPTQLFPE